MVLPRASCSWNATIKQLADYIYVLPFQCTEAKHCKRDQWQKFQSLRRNPSFQHTNFCTFVKYVHRLHFQCHVSNKHSPATKSVPLCVGKGTEYCNLLRSWRNTTVKALQLTFVPKPHHTHTPRSLCLIKPWNGPAEINSIKVLDVITWTKSIELTINYKLLIMVVV